MSSREVGDVGAVVINFVQLFDPVENLVGRNLVVGILSTAPGLGSDIELIGIDAACANAVAIRLEEESLEFVVFQVALNGFNDIHM